MRRINVAVKKAHGDGFDAFTFYRIQNLIERVHVERGQHFAFIVKAFRDFITVFARNQRRRKLRLKCIQNRAILPSDEQQIAEAFCGDQSGFRALAFQNGVGSNRRAVRDASDCLNVTTDRCQPVQHGAGGVVRRAQELMNPQLTVFAEDEIGERPADVYADVHKVMTMMGSMLMNSAPVAKVSNPARSRMKSDYRRAKLTSRHWQP